MREYGVGGDPSDYQEDHLISLELGGHPTDPRNLWPEPHPHATEVDRIENELNAQGLLRRAHARRGAAARVGAEAQIGVNRRAGWKIRRARADARRAALDDPRRPQAARPRRGRSSARCSRSACALAQQAPTGSYPQDWHFVVVTDPELRAGLAELWRQGGEKYLAGVGRPGGRCPGMMGRVLGGVFHLRDHLHEVPVHVIPCIEGRTDGKGVFAQASRWGSIMPAAWSFMLAARSRGLGTVWTTFHLAARAGGGRAARDPLRRGDAGGADPGRLHDRDRVQAGGAGAARHDGALGPLVAVSFRGVTFREHVRPVVVAGRVEALPLLVQPLRLEVGVEDPLLVVERAGEVRAVRARGSPSRRGRGRPEPAISSRSGKSSGYERRAGSGTGRRRTRATRGRCGRASPARRRRRRRSRRCRSRRPTRRARSARAACSSPSRSARRSGRAASGARAGRRRRPGPRSAARGSSGRACGGGARARRRAVVEERVVERARAARGRARSRR